MPYNTNYYPKLIRNYNNRNRVQSLISSVHFRFRVTFLGVMRIPFRELERKTRLAVGQIRAVQILLRYETLSRFQRLRKSEMYSRRDRDTRDVVPLLGVITHITPSSRSDRFRAF